MLSPEEIIEGVSPLTRTKVRALDAIIRNSDAYEGNRARYTGVYAALVALESAPASPAGAESSDDAAIRAKTLDQLLVILKREVDRGTIAVLGGDSGKDFSQVRDREDLIAFALRALFDEEERSDEPASNYVAVLPQGAGGGCYAVASCACGFLQCPICRGLLR